MAIDINKLPPYYQKELERIAKIGMEVREALLKGDLSSFPFCPRFGSEYSCSGGGCKNCYTREQFCGKEMIQYEKWKAFQLKSSAPVSFSSVEDLRAYQKDKKEKQ